MSFSDKRRRRDGSEGRGVEGKHTVSGIIGAEIFKSQIHIKHPFINSQK